MEASSILLNSGAPLRGRHRRACSHRDEPCGTGFVIAKSLGTGSATAAMGGRVRRAMPARLLLIVSALGLASGGCAKKPGPILWVVASYPGADSQTVANVIAAPIEQQINGVEGLLRLESESGDDGSYAVDAALSVRNRPAGCRHARPESRPVGRADFCPEQVRMSYRNLGENRHRRRRPYSVAAICLIDSEVIKAPTKCAVGPRPSRNGWKPPARPTIPEYSRAPRNAESPGESIRPMRRLVRKRPT